MKEAGKWWVEMMKVVRGITGNVAKKLYRKTVRENVDGGILTKQYFTGIHTESRK
jgi:hypothetical protein